MQFHDKPTHFLAAEKSRESRKWLKPRRRENGSNHLDLGLLEIQRDAVSGYLSTWIRQSGGVLSGHLHFHLLSLPLGNIVPENRMVKWSVHGSFLGSPPPGHDFVTFLLREIRHLFLDPVSFCLCNPLLPPFGPTRNLRCTVLGDQFQASFLHPFPYSCGQKMLDPANCMDSFMARSPAFL